jgi:1-acyl-sn-glycerol-3-phosphate acyltransferase
MKVGFSFFWARAFEYILHRMRRQHLEGIAVKFAPEWKNAALDKSKPLLFVANHAGNWDGFLLRALQKKIHPEARLFSIMLESELQQRPIFRRIGGLGLIPGNARTVLRLLRDLKSLRSQNPGMVVSLFPQGKIVPPWLPLHFEPGALAIAKALLPVTVVPVALRYECLTGLKPTALMAVQAPLPCETLPPALPDLVNAVASGLAELADHVAAAGDTLSSTWEKNANCFWWRA